MAASRLRVAARQRHVDVADLVDLEALADRFDAAERLEDLPHALRRDAKDLEVDVLRALAVARGRSGQDSIAHPAADDESAAARVAEGGRDVAGALQRRGHRSAHVCDRLA